MASTGGAVSASGGKALAAAAGFQLLRGPRLDFGAAVSQDSTSVYLMNAAPSHHQTSGCHFARGESVRPAVSVVNVVWGARPRCYAEGRAPRRAPYQVSRASSLDLPAWPQVLCAQHYACTRITTIFRARVSADGRMISKSRLPN